jgi:transglutaminase-like putative cysteine protease
MQAILLALSLFPLAQGQVNEKRLDVDTSRPQRSFRFVHSAGLPDVPAGARESRLWVPIPIDTPDQTIAHLAVRGSGGSTDFSTDGVRPTGSAGSGAEEVRWSLADIRHGSGRSLCVETRGMPIQLEITFDVTRYESQGGGRATADELAQARAADKLIPLTGKVARMASAMKLDADPLKAGRSLYDFVLERMKYDKPEGQPWGKGDAEWACDSRFGNCTDFHSVFIGLARAKGIPARFEMGFAVPGGSEPELEIKGYHCWAYFWSEGRGWVPVDISEADKDPSKAEYFFGRLDADRFTVTVGRDVELTPAPKLGARNFFVYPYAEVDGVEAKTTRAFRRLLKP